MALGDKARKAALEEAAKRKLPSIGSGEAVDVNKYGGSQIVTTEMLDDAKRMMPQFRETDREQDFSVSTRAEIAIRSDGKCEARYSNRCLGRGTEVHHRKLRRFGDHRAVNGLHVCKMCHMKIHDNPTVSYRLGLMVRSTDDPAEKGLTGPPWSDRVLT